MGEDEVVSQYSALASMVFMMAFTIIFDGMIWRNRRCHRLEYFLKQFCRLSAY